MGSASHSTRTHREAAVSKGLTEYGAILRVFFLGILAQNGSEAVVINLFFVGHHEISPAFLARGALHLILVYRLGRVKFGKIFLEVLVNLIVKLGQAKGAALDFLENCPICLEVLNGCTESS